MGNVGGVPHATTYLPYMGFCWARFGEQTARVLLLPVMLDEAYCWQGEKNLTKSCVGQVFSLILS